MEGAAGQSSGGTAALRQGYRSESNAIDQGQFSVLMQNLNELQSTLSEASHRLESKTNTLLGVVPQPASPPSSKMDSTSPNGVVQSMTWGVRDMIAICGGIHDQINRIDQAGLGQ